MALQTLSAYLLAARRLLHDANGNFWSDSELTDYINEARLRAVVDTGCNRVLQTTYLTAGQEMFTFGSVTGGQVLSAGVGFTDGTYALTLAGGNGAGASGTYTCLGGSVVSVTMTAGGDGYTVAPTPSFPLGGGTGASGVLGVISDDTVDVINATIIWGAQRIPLNYMVFTKLNAYLRAVRIVASMPQVFSIYGQDALYIQPVPDQVYPIELDSVVTLVDLVNTTDVDPIRYPFNLGIPSYAAYMAKYKEGDADSAARFLSEYKMRVQAAIRSSVTRRLPSAYGR